MIGPRAALVLTEHAKTILAAMGLHVEEQIIDGKKQARWCSPWEQVDE